MPTPNTFTGANLSFANRGIHFMLAEVIKFRKQLVVRDEFKAQSGWDNALNSYMVEELEKLGDTLENTTYKPENVTKDELEANAADTTRALADDYNADALATDNVTMPSAVPQQIVWDLSGADPDLPQLTPNNCPNDAGRGFISELDRFFVALTRLDSRHNSYTVSKNDSLMMRSLLNVLYTICMRKGGEVNRSDIPTGTLPSQEGGTFNGVVA